MLLFFIYKKIKVFENKCKEKNTGRKQAMHQHFSGRSYVPVLHVLSYVQCCLVGGEVLP